MLIRKKSRNICQYTYELEEKETNSLAECNMHTDVIKSFYDLL